VIVSRLRRSAITLVEALALNAATRVTGTTVITV
jgi:hypothetical protein